MIEQSYSTQEVAKLFGCDEDTVLRYAQRGELESWRLGNQRKYTESAVREFMESRQEGTRSRVRLRRAS